MPDDNRISETLTPAALTAIEAGFKMIRDNLPFLINLKPAERNALPKLVMVASHWMKTPTL